MDRTELENLIRFAKMNSMKSWSFEEVLNEYETTKMHHKEPKFDPHTLHPFDKILARDGNHHIWECALLSHIDDLNEEYKVITVGSCYTWCIPYNEETKNLVGTKDDCPEYYKWWEEQL